jgi:hypothetical protein
VHSLPESGSLPSAWRFAECFLSSTRQSSTLGKNHIFREQESRHRKTLVKNCFAECRTLGEWRRSTKGHQQPSIADGRYLCRASSFGTRQRSYFAECAKPDTRQTMLCQVSILDTRQSIFVFSQSNFFYYVLYYVNLNVPFWHNYKSVCYNY